MHKAGNEEQRSTRCVVWVMQRQKVWL